MLVLANRSQSVDDLAAAAAAAEVSHGTCYKILTDDLNMSRVTQQCVPRVLTQDQRDDLMRICGDLISADDNPTFLNRIITVDETRFFLYRSKGKVMLELFFFYSVEFFTWNSSQFVQL